MFHFKIPLVNLTVSILMLAGLSWAGWRMMPSWKSLLAGESPTGGTDNIQLPSLQRPALGRGSNEGVVDPFRQEGEFDAWEGDRDAKGETESPGRAYRPIRTYWRQKRLPERDEFPQWRLQPSFQQDVFTFVRIQYDAYGPFGWWDRWDNDYPDGDWNFSYRLQQLTSLSVDPNGRVLKLTDPELFNYPFLYMAGVQRVTFNAAERLALRRYLLNGGFLMMDDFWAESGWRNVRREMNAVLPNRQPIELTLDHPIFHWVYDLKELPQVCDLKTWSEGYSFEFWHDGFSADQAPHFWAYFDDDGRMIALCCHNNDIGDGWEREGENREYFERFSEKISYPLGINIITYAMTH